MTLGSTLAGSGVDVPTAAVPQIDVAPEPADTPHSGGRHAATGTDDPTRAMPIYSAGGPADTGDGATDRTTDAPVAGEAEAGGADASGTADDSAASGADEVMAAVGSATVAADPAATEATDGGGADGSDTDAPAETAPVAVKTRKASGSGSRTLMTVRYSAPDGEPVAGEGGDGDGPGRKERTKRDGKPRKPRSPLWTKLVIVLGALVMLASGGSMVLLKVAEHEVDTALPTMQLIDHGTTPVTIDGTINILMVGIDTRPTNLSLGSRSDSIIIGHIPATHDRIDLVSIPRDTWVDIPPNPATGWAGGSAKINAAFLLGSRNGGGDTGGMELLQKTITNLTGITFQGAMVVNFSGFWLITNRLGGVWMTVDEKAVSLHHGYLTANPTVSAAPFVVDPNTGTPVRSVPGVTPVIYYPGYQHLTATQALDYVRIRDGLPNSDYDRERHQQQFIKALAKEAYQEGMSDPTKITSFISALGKAFEWDGGGRSLSEWIFTLKGIDPSGIVTIKTNDGQFNSKVIAGQSTEALTDTSMQLMHAVRDDTVDQFIAEYPSWVTTS